MQIFCNKPFKRTKKQKKVIRVPKIWSDDEYLPLTCLKYRVERKCLSSSVLCSAHSKKWRVFFFFLCSLARKPLRSDCAQSVGHAQFSITTRPKESFFFFFFLPWKLSELSHLLRSITPPHSNPPLPLYLLLLHPPQKTSFLSAPLLIPPSLVNAVVVINVLRRYLRSPDRTLKKKNRSIESLKFIRFLLMVWIFMEICGVLQSHMKIHSLTRCSIFYSPKTKIGPEAKHLKMHSQQTTRQIPDQWHRSIFSSNK